MKIVANDPRSALMSRSFVEYAHLEMQRILILKRVIRYYIYRSFLLLFIALFTTYNLNAQTCLSEGITFSSQEQIDSFPVKYSGCTSIIGDVIIGGWSVISEINNLDSLVQITRIDGDLLVFRNPDLKSLSGLREISIIHGDLEISGNSQFSDLRGLDNLTSISRDLNLPSVQI